MKPCDFFVDDMCTHPIAVGEYGVLPSKSVHTLCQFNTSKEWPGKTELRVILQAVPFDRWPVWAKSVAALAKPADTGIGDTAAREIAAVGLVGFQVKHNVNFGPSCGCGAKEWSEETRAKWNERWAYTAIATPNPPIPSNCPA